MLQAPDPTPYDLQFQTLGIPIRVSAWFWLGGIFFGFSLVRPLDRMFETGSPGVLPLLVLWLACLLVSILVHELGHSLAFRRFGVSSSIVLYHFGGLAIPDQGRSFGGRSASSLTPKESIVVSLAGPLFQMATGFVLWGVIKMMGNGLSFAGYYPLSYWPFDLIPGFTEGEPIERPALYALMVFYLLPSFLWALLNLIPVLPLDGGRVCSSIVELCGAPASVAIQISLIASIAVAVYSYSHGQTFLALMFAMFGYGNYQTLQHYGGGRY